MSAKESMGSLLWLVLTVCKMGMESKGRWVEVLDR
jgi:hypothetical protein